MTDAQKKQKQFIEKCAKDTIGINLVVEYVPDVSMRVLEITSKYSENIYNAYNAKHFTGTFIPQVGENPYYILVQQKRNQQLDVMTVYHEYQHVIDYVRFLDTVFHGDVEALKKSPLYYPFNVYSEFSATKAGITHYGKTVKFLNTPIEDRCIALLETYLNMYRNFYGIESRGDFLIHTIQYYGCIMAIPSICQSVDLLPFLEDFLVPVVSSVSFFSSSTVS